MQTEPTLSNNIQTIILLQFFHNIESLLRQVIPVNVEVCNQLDCQTINRNVSISVGNEALTIPYFLSRSAAEKGS